MGIFSKFKEKIMSRVQRWKEVGEYRSTFSSFGTEAYRSEIVRSCIRPLADFTSKAECRCSDLMIARILNERPNIYMNGREFLAKVRTLYELRNNCFIYIERDDRGKACGFFPVNYSTFEALDYNGRLFIKFHFSTGDSKTIPWDDLAVIRKDYANSNLAGDENDAILSTLEMITVSNQGIANAVKATANLRGILKSTKAMLAPEDVKEQKEQFVKDYLSLENEGGIASLDATQEFTPINMSPVITTYQQMKEFRENVYRYFGVNDKITMSNMNGDELEVFYETKIEPFLVDLSTELTSKVFTKRELGFNNWLIFEANKLQFSSLPKKISMFSTVVLYGGMTINEWRQACNMVTVPWGDEPIRRLDAGSAISTNMSEESANQISEGGSKNGEGTQDV